MTEGIKGVLAMVGACTIWGLSPLFFKLIAHVPPLEVLAHRTIWSLAALSVILAVRGHLGRIRDGLAKPGAAVMTLLAALVISTNWFAFIHSVQVGRALEASLGYYIFPLVAVLFGVAFFGDRLRPLQGVAVALAATAVTVLTLGLGVLPVISLFLAVTFAMYGALKRRLRTDPVASVAAEVALLAPAALVWLALVHGGGWTDMTGRPGAVFAADLFSTVLLVMAGPVTAVPLWLFSYAAQRVVLPTLGLIQYMNPTLQFLCATLVFAEPVTVWHALAFPVIWLGLAIYSHDGLRHARRLRQEARTLGL
ncbi:EamA family transporter RarD [Meridianimarinicoccus sp. RP-17]|uniref:EamA family transporter RarD n=1 Tax=Meridianimarinicoccus zhengii TaxID=2056810 RepID=UPI000DAE1422|nr:EamA family transporter RarD [Phycocomes zhengii]